MAIVNRDKDASEQRECFTTSIAPSLTGLTYGVCVVPYQSNLVSAMVQGNGLSGSPNYSLWIQRFVVGSGVTSINIGSSLVLTTFGTSGAMTFSIPGSLTYPLQASDVITLSMAAANTATANTTVTVVLRALQDIKTAFGA